MLDGVEMIQKTTYKAGGARIKSLNEGTYTVTVAKPCYITQTLTVPVTKNKLTQVEVKLVRVAP
jgi:hypothetical protein